MRSKRVLRATAAEARIKDSVRWIKNHGGDEAGYVANYHDKHGLPVKQAKLIYYSDLEALQYAKHNHAKALLGIET